MGFLNNGQGHQEDRQSMLGILERGGTKGIAETCGKGRCAPGQPVMPAMSISLSK